MGKVTFLGVEGSGKTVLATALLNVFKAHENEGWYLRPNSREAFRFQMQSPAVLANGGFPHQTTALKHLSWNVQWNGKPLRSLDILDYPGEIFRLAFLDAEDDLDPAGFKERVAANKEEIDALLSHLVDSDQVFVLFNLTDSDDLSSNQSNLDAVWITNACLDYLDRLPNHPSVSLLLTQIDRYVDLANYDVNGDVYVAHHLPLIYSNHTNLDVLTVSAIVDAAGNHGVDRIIERCLSGSLSNLARDDELEKCMDAVREFFSVGNMDFMSSDKTVALFHAVRQCRSREIELPWFASPGSEQDAVRTDADRLLDDVCKIIVALKWRGAKINVHDSRVWMMCVTASTSEGKKYRRKMLAKLEDKGFLDFMVFFAGAAFVVVLLALLTIASCSAQ